MMFPQLLISKAVADAKKKIHLKVEQQKLPGGVNKKLINYLLAAGTTECVCGRPLCAEEKAHMTRSCLCRIACPYAYTKHIDDRKVCALSSWMLKKNIDIQK